MTIDNETRAVRPTWPATILEALGIVRAYASGDKKRLTRDEARFIAEVLEDATEDDLAKADVAR